MIILSRVVASSRLIALVLLFSGGLLAVPAAVHAATGSKNGKFVEIQRVVSPGGIKAWLVNDASIPIISMRFAFRGGASLDPVGKEGLAEMTSALIDEGAGDLNSETFQRRLQDLSITLRFSAGRDTFSGNLTTLTKNRKQAFDLLHLALTSPRFDAEPVSRIRSQLLSGLRSDLADPGTIAGRTLSKMLFPGHPYGRPVEGSVKSIKAITATDLKGFTARRLAQDNLYIGVVGDISAEELAKKLDKIFGSLPKKAAPYVVADVVAKADGRTRVVDMAVPQSSIVFAQKGLKRNDPDFFTAYVLNHILGSGGLTSRLYDQIREKRGLAYSIGSYLYPMQHSALIYGSGGTANKRVGETIAVLKTEWRKMAEHGVTKTELADAKTYLTGSYPLRFTSSGNIASILVAVQVEKLGIDYLEKRNSLIEAVSLKQVNRLAKKLLDANSLTIVVVGQPKGVKSTP